MDVNEKEAKKDSATAPTIIEQYSFGLLCSFLEKVSTYSKSSKKRALLETLWKKLGMRDLYPLMRLLLPQLDLERSGYGVKEKKIADFYVKAIPLPSASVDAKKLKHFKNPTYAGQDVGDFTNCLYCVLQHRCISSSKKRLFEVNADLDKLRRECETQQLKIEWFQHLMSNYTAMEQKWLMRIILKDLKCGVRHESCLKAFHMHALDTYNMTSSLLKVCQMAGKPHSELGANHNIQVELFVAIKPMLASRRHWNQVISVMRGSFGIEIKFDGERVMMHYLKSEDKLMLWSRNCIDLEKKYGYVAAFGDILKKQMRCESCILDGEMMSYDENIGCFIPFGSNRTVAQDEDNTAQHLCYIAFDILLCDGEITMDMTLSRRRKILETVFESKSSYFEMTKMVKRIENTADIMDALDTALQDHHEGIMVKALNSVYVCNKRGNDWIKLKPDYVDGMVGCMDLLILGGYFGQGKKRVGDISHFLLGCRNTQFYKENDDDDDDGDDIDLPTQFYTFCKVGTGYKIQELKQLQEHLRAYWKPFRRNHIVSHFMGWQPQPDDVPDVWIEPKHSVIVELLANEIVTTKNGKFHAGLTVRFPRCRRLRYDKAWYECISLKEIQHKFNDKNKYHNTRTAAEIAILNDEDNQNHKKKRKNTRNAPTIMRQFRPADTSNVVIKSDIFENKEFCVLNGMELDGEMNKEELEKVIVANGGIITQNPLIVSTHYLIAETITPRVNNIIQSNTQQLNVIRPLWIRQSVEQKRMLPFAPVFMIHSTQSTAHSLKQQYDAFGDHYARSTNVDRLHQVFRKINKNNNAFGEQLTDEEQMMLIAGYNRFRRCVIYIDCYDPINTDQLQQHEASLKLSSVLRMVDARLRLYGATVSNYLDVTVTHIVVDDDDKARPRLKAIRNRINHMMHNDPQYQWRPYLITAKWVQHSILAQAIIQDYHKYEPRVLSFPQHSS